MNTKKIIIISSVVIGVLAIGLGIFFAWQKTKETPSDLLTALAPSASITTTTSTKVIAPKLKVISKNNVFAYWTVTANSTSSAPITNIFYFSPEGNVFTIKQNNELILSNSNIENLQSVNPSPDGKLVLIKSGLFEKFRVEILNVETNIWQQPMEGVISADWSPDGKKIIYTQKNTGNGIDLMVKDAPSNSQFATSTQKITTQNKPQKIMSLNQTDFDFEWYSNDNIFLIPKPSINYVSEIWDINIKTKVISRVITGNGLMVNWLKFGSLGLKFSSNTGRDYGFSMIDNRGNIKGDFKFKTFPDKCLINSVIQVYCAISKDQSLFANYNFPDDYLKKSIYFNDGIYSIDVLKNQIRPLFDGDSPAIDAINLKLAGNQLLFINRYDQKLYSLDL